jgi:hypothetical protein
MNTGLGLTPLLHSTVSESSFKSLTILKIKPLNSLSGFPTILILWIFYSLYREYKRYKDIMGDAE